jgi:ABC-type dipeptide/oligopeptide/nickel transport system permease component
MAIIIIVALLVILANLIADIAYAWLDPRVKYERGAH